MKNEYIRSEFDVVANYVLDMRRVIQLMRCLSHESPAERLILVIDGDGAPAQNLKELIEFMDVPRVQISAPENWQSKLGDRRLAAIFLGRDLSEDQINRLMEDICGLDPNVPIVMVYGDQTDA